MISKRNSLKIEDVRILFDKHHTFLVKDISKDFSTHKGTIRKKDLLKTSGEVKTTQGYKYNILKPNLSDIYNIIRRKPQIILQKDIGFIIAYTGLNKESVVLEGGTGSGCSAIVLANLCKKVYSYEWRKEHFDFAKENIEFFNVENVELYLKNIYEGIEQRDLDLILLDLPEPWNVLPYAVDSLKVGAWMVAYLPNLTQVKILVEKLRDFPKFKLDSIKTLYEQNWIVEDKVLRPVNREYLNFTAFIVFVRKLDE